MLYRVEEVEKGDNLGKYASSTTYGNVINFV